MKIVGIDLGTTNSAIAVLNEFGKAEIIPNKEGERITPSVVLFDGDNIIIGTIAKQSAVADPENTVSHIKSQMGNPDYIFIHKDMEFSPEDISAMILRKLIDDAEEYLEEKITDVVITVPAYFDDKQRKATMDAGEIAGVKVRQILNEPTAAALTFGLEKDDNSTVMVYDFGGGTFDVTIMKISGPKFDVIASDGDRKLGGNDFDDRLMNYLNEQFLAECGIDLLSDPVLMQDLRMKSENAKKTLSSKKSVNVYLSAQGKSSKIEITREKFRELIADLIARTELHLEAVLQDAKMDWSQIDHILLVGGTTRVPAVSERLRAISGKEPVTSLNPDEAVALGAAIQSGLIMLKGEERDQLSDMVKMKLDKMEVNDVTSHSFGAITLDDYNKKRNAIIIPKNSKIPIKKSQIFYTTVPGQTSVTLTVIQGEDTDPEYCTEIGKTTLSFPSKPINSPIIFNYEYDINGIIQATAKDPDSGEKSVIKIQKVGELSGDEVRMKSDTLKEIMPKRRDFIPSEEYASTVSGSINDNSIDEGDNVVSEIFEIKENLISEEDLLELDALDKEIEREASFSKESASFAIDSKIKKQTNELIDDDEDEEELVLIKRDDSVNLTDSDLMNIDSNPLIDNLSDSFSEEELLEDSDKPRIFVDESDIIKNEMDETQKKSFSVDDDILELDEDEDVISTNSTIMDWISDEDEDKQ
ncbi:MAG: Hsp70 family protein [Candidatus Delongbacteria bacterium]|nr:Hsp70 family protein [Candidatus Delongbacteria bacterium]MBN2836113.1 Hsp70 family protein [Candidatus Delongbacteria bacterium]